MTDTSKFNHFSTFIKCMHHVVCISCILLYVAFCTLRQYRDRRKPETGTMTYSCYAPRVLFWKKNSYWYKKNGIIHYNKDVPSICIVDFKKNMDFFTSQRWLNWEQIHPLHVVRFVYRLEVLSRYHDPQFQVVKNYWYLFDFVTKNLPILMFKTYFIPTSFGTT